MSQVSSHSPPAKLEIDLLKRSIPEEGKKKLYEVESLTSPWRLLDNLYGNESLICQKLKLRLKNLTPKAKEDHEVIIELNDVSILSCEKAWNSRSYQSSLL